MSEICLIVRVIQQDIVINVYRSSYNVPVSDFSELALYRQSFEKYSNVKFHENPSSGSRVVPCGQTDGHDEANSLFHNCANASKNGHFRYR